MTNERLDYYRLILLERREFVIETIERLKESSQVEDEEIEYNKNYPDHMAGQGTDSISKEESFLFISRELRYLNRIDNALKSIDKGIYGKCKSCGKEISSERLKAVPLTGICIKCKKSFVINRNLN